MKELRDIINGSDFTANFIDEKYRKIELSYKGHLLGVYNGKNKVEKIVTRSWVVNTLRANNNENYLVQKKILMDLISDRVKS